MHDKGDTPRIKLSPELSDGSSWSIVGSPSAAVELIREWFDEHAEQVGESFTVEIVAMTQEEVDALPSL